MTGKLRAKTGADAAHERGGVVGRVNPRHPDEQIDAAHPDDLTQEIVGHQVAFGHARSSG
jgi:hypothetical protein